MATVSMDSIQFYQPPFMTPLFSGKYTALPHIDPKPSVEPRYLKGSQVLESVDVTALDGWGDFGLQHHSGQDQDAVSEDDLPTLEELLRPTLRKKVLIKSLKNLSTHSKRPTSKHGQISGCRRQPR
jgi:hypothetical protein